MTNERRSIGVDIGGSKISVGLVDGAGGIQGSRSFPTAPEEGFQPAMSRVVRAIEDLLASAGLARQGIVGIGIGCPGPVSPTRGTIHNPFTLPTWDGANPVQLLGEIFSLPVYLENDTDAALIGEACAGAARSVRDVVMLTFGTGVGGAALVDGKIYRGVNGEHPEIGHMVVASDGPECYCGVRGCLESLASGTAVTKAGQTEGFADAAEVFRGARAGDKAALALVGRVVLAAASAFWTILHTFMPQLVVIGGGLMQEHYPIFEPALLDRARSAEQAWGQPFRVAKAELDNDAGLVGAAFLALRPNEVNA